MVKNGAARKKEGDNLSFGVKEDETQKRQGNPERKKEEKRIAGEGQSRRGKE